MQTGHPSTLDKLEAGLLGRDEFQQQVLDELYSGLYQYCRIPDGYRHCELATRTIDLDALDEKALRQLLRNPPAEIINPYPSHIKSIELFRLLLSGDA